MLKNTTLNLPEELIARTKAYAAAHGTTMTALVRQHLEAITSVDENQPANDPLVAYSEGRLSRNEAIRMLGLRDYAQLLVALGDAISRCRCRHVTRSTMRPLLSSSFGIGREAVHGHHSGLRTVQQPVGGRSVGASTDARHADCRDRCRV